MKELEFDSEKVIALFTRIWEFSIFEVSGRSVTVSNLLVGLLFFAGGMIAARYISRYLRQLMMKRAKLETGPAATLESLTFYFLLIIFTFLALNISNIPLTIFTVLGGAVALGVGFGSQNVVRNFISGIILLIERPIQVGSIVEIEGTRGSVERIGTRSTIVRSYDNFEIVVPNSSFLEKNVINWTLGDNIVRSKVTVGVAYGSPTERVKEILLNVSEKHADILGFPKPSVLFSDFGDSALIFDLFFWIRITDMYKKLRIESDVRFEIDKQFRESES